MEEDKKIKQISEENVYVISALARDPWPMFGIYYPVFISAVAFAKLNETDTVTKAEMQKHIDNYMNHPVKG